MLQFFHCDSRRCNVDSVIRKNKNLVAFLSLLGNLVKMITILAILCLSLQLTVTTAWDLNPTTNGPIIVETTFASDLGRSQDQNQDLSEDQPSRAYPSEEVVEDFGLPTVSPSASEDAVESLNTSTVENEAPKIQTDSSKRKCEIKRNCFYHEECINGVCTIDKSSITMECKDKSDCHFAEECIDNYCEPLDSSCLYPSDYWDGTQCKNVTNHRVRNRLNSTSRRSRLNITENPALLKYINALPVEAEKEADTEQELVTTTLPLSDDESITPLPPVMITNMEANSILNPVSEEPVQQLHIFETFTSPPGKDESTKEQKNAENFASSFPLGEVLGMNTNRTNQQRALFPQGSSLGESGAGNETSEIVILGDAKNETQTDQTNSSLNVYAHAQDKQHEKEHDLISAPVHAANNTTSAPEHPEEKPCTSKYECKFIEICLEGRCVLDPAAHKCSNSSDCNKWESCTGNVCLPLEDRCPKEGEYWDGKKCENLPSTRTAEVIISIIAVGGLVGVFVLIGFLVRTGCLPTTGFSPQRSIRRTKRPKISESEIEDEDFSIESLDKNVTTTNHRSSKARAKARAKGRPQGRSRSQSVPNLGDTLPI